MLEETIIAISTPLGYGGLGVIRISGSKALDTARRIFKPKGRQKNIHARRPVLGNLFDSETQKNFEEAYLTYFPSPRSYTTEDVVEISCHGSPVILEEVIRLGIRAGARHAHPGEFTLRAYLGGRIDLIQAEAINDVIRASSLKQAKISFRQLEGKLSQKIKTLRDKIIHILSQIEASIEFPDERLNISSNRISATIRKALNSVNSLIKSYDLGRTLSEGLTLAITGKTNVGKSTLFNTLLEKDRAIVTPFPGTTRDYLKENFAIKDSIFTLIDMAGLNNTEHPVEKEGIKKGKKLATKADGILLLLDGSRQETQEDIELIKKYKNKQTILVINKVDLPQRINLNKIDSQASYLPRLEISALEGRNIDQLKDIVFSLFVQDEQKSDDVILHLRQKLLLEDIREALSNSLDAAEEGFTEEILVEEIRKTIPLIEQLTGEIKTDDVLEDVFNRFCIGK